MSEQQSVTPMTDAYFAEIVTELGLDESEAQAIRALAAASFMEGYVACTNNTINLLSHMMEAGKQPVPGLKRYSQRMQIYTDIASDVGETISAQARQLVDQTTASIQAIREAPAEETKPAKKAKSKKARAKKAPAKQPEEAEAVAPAVTAPPTYDAPDDDDMDGADLLAARR